MADPINLSQWSRSLNAYADWLSANYQENGRAWSKRVNSHQTDAVEAATAEALVWDFIFSRVDEVRLNEDPGIGGVDFEFIASGNRFLVEVTNISIAAAANASGLPDTELFRGYYALLTKHLRQKIRNKLAQARRQNEVPLLVAVTTLHRNASNACVNRNAIQFAMGSPPRISVKYDARTGDAAGDLYETTDLSQSVFLSPNSILDSDGREIIQAKYQPISGFLFGGFGIEPENVAVLGGLNPSATRPFDPALLPDVPFCTFGTWPAFDSIDFNWTITQEEEDRRKRIAAEKRIHQAGLGGLLNEFRHEFSKGSSTK